MTIGKVSVFTPTNNTHWIRAVYASLVTQTYQNWEWVIVPNGGVTVPVDIVSDPRVVVRPRDSNSVGALKRYACDNCTGDVFVELDHDDQLTPDCLAKIAGKAETCGFVYSDSAEVDPQGKQQLFSPRYGWQYYAAELFGMRLQALSTFDLSPRMLCEIFYAPNHVRAWRRDAYYTAGGHDVALPIGDDHDLVCRTYLASAVFGHIPECLYLYLAHGKNTCVTANAPIQVQQAKNRDKYLRAIVAEWCLRTQLPVLALDGMALSVTPDAAVLAALPENTVGAVRCVDYLQRLPMDQAIRLVNDIYRVLVPGGFLLTDTPSTDGRGAFQSPTHLSFWNPNSFQYLTDKRWARHVPEYKGRFQLVSRSQGYNCPEDEALRFIRVRADMCVIKGGRHPGLQLL